MLRSKFCRRIGISASLLFAFTLAFPFILLALVMVLAAGKCGGGGACGLAAVVIGKTLQPLGAIALLSLMGMTVGQRASALGLNRTWLVFTVAWLLALLPVTAELGNPIFYWDLKFGLGQIFLRLPILPLFLVTFVAFLALHPDEDLPANKVLWLVAVIAAGHAVACSTGEIRAAILAVPFLGGALEVPQQSSLLSWGSIWLAKFSAFASLGIGKSMKLIDWAVFTLALALLLLSRGKGTSAHAVHSSAPAGGAVLGVRRVARIASAPGVGTTHQAGFGRQ